METKSYFVFCNFYVRLQTVTHILSSYVVYDIVRVIHTPVDNNG